VALGTCTTLIWLIDGFVPNSITKPARSMSGIGCSSGDPYIRWPTRYLLVRSWDAEEYRLVVPRPCMNAV
jgi:hypothetical protein